ELVGASLDEELGLCRRPEEREVRAIHRNAQTNEVGHSAVFAADAQPHPRAKAESRQQDGYGGKLFRDKIERGAKVVLLANSAVMTTFAPRSILSDRKSTRLNSSHGSISYAV